MIFYWIGTIYSSLRRWKRDTLDVVFGKGLLLLSLCGCEENG
ncbi:hypothetical protein POREN0001_0319 [Porphyromonas endodontalis ATCC 35406]|uniref:Uncharacterized protein n=1 Tax=Porphyromonas endodontalis (strain ATCC 35406 / DSM 24491 / JCM 8526 / CCUG 16442 / BCRC 14492 / NCTC 13058 / HG 370) TaxID=553175 RepID=C3JAT1_POREA|nr:hypothetical protein POREN0001_0319 [Porphyromonas endodontalis ATCC 35406]